MISGGGARAKPRNEVDDLLGGPSPFGDSSGASAIPPPTMGSDLPDIGGGGPLGGLPSLGGGGRKPFGGLGGVGGRAGAFEYDQAALKRANAELAKLNRIGDPDFE